jgi:methionine-rich copper-binding protein CopC
VHTPTSTHRRARRAVPAVAAAALLAVSAGAALAHTGVRSTSPAKGATVKNLPSTIRITFTEPLGRVNSVKVMRRGVNHATRARLNPRRASQVLVSTRANRVGAYTVVWTVTSADGHRQAGSFAFRVRR